MSVDDEIDGIIRSIKKLMRRVRIDKNLTHGHTTQDESEYEDWIEGILDSAIAVLSVAKGDK